jgi:O-antigen biosynthesis protein
MKKQFNIIQLPADTSGCSWYRLLMPQYTIESSAPELNFSISRRFIADIKYFEGVNLIMAQRQVNNPQEIYFNKFLVPVSKAKGAWLIYNIDDCIYKDDIPKYNQAYSVYQDDQLMDNIKRMLNNADFILTTTETLKEYYVDRFNVDEKNIIVIPNYIPKWWMGQYFDVNKSVERFNHHKNKPRVGIISSASHYNVNGVECDQKDDLELIYDVIEKTCNKYQWVMLGVPHYKLIPLIQQGKVHFHRGCDILHYPHVIDSLQLQAIVAPLQDNIFNRCKSNIKLLEGAALGVPVICSNLPVYSKYTDLVFDNHDELINQLSGLLLRDKYHYKTIVQKNYDFMNTPQVDVPNGWWLENNMNQWLKLYKLRSKAIEFNFEAYMNNKQKNNSYDTLFKQDNIEIVS